MTTTLTPFAELDDTGVGTDDIQGSLQAATETDHDYVNDGRIEFFVDNQSGAPVTATLVAKASRGRDTPANDRAITVPAGQMGSFPPHSPALFGGGATKAQVNLSAFASVNVGIRRTFTQGR